MTLILPTGRAVALVAAAPLVALLLAALAPRLWLLGPAYLGVVLLALALDGLLAMPLRRLAVRFQPPDMLFVGETAAAVLDLTPGGRRIPPRIDAVIDHGPTVEMPALLEIASQGAQTIRTEIPLLPRRRGTAPLTALWLRWTGPYGLMRLQAKQPLDVKLKVVPNIRAVRVGLVLRSDRPDLSVGTTAGGGSTGRWFGDPLPLLENASRTLSNAELGYYRRQTAMTTVSVRNLTSRGMFTF